MADTHSALDDADVPTPDQFGLDPYEDLELTAQDGVKLKCYLLVQSKVLPQAEAPRVPVDDGLTDAEVTSIFLLQAFGVAQVR